MAAPARSTCRPSWRGSSTRPEDRRQGRDSYVTAERLLQALAVEPSEAAKALKAAGATAQGLNEAINAIRKGRDRRHGLRRTGL